MGASISADSGGLGQAGCNLDKTVRPDLAGPSELAASLGMSANPDQLTANGNSSSVIEATLRGPDGNLAANTLVIFDLLARGAGNFSDIGVLAPIGGPRPVPGGPRRPQTVTGVTNGNGVARVRYWSPFRTDQENDIVVTITGRPEGDDFRTAIFRQVDIFLRAANRPMFPGSGGAASWSSRRNRCTMSANWSSSPRPRSPVPEVSRSRDTSGSSTARMSTVMGTQRLVPRSATWRSRLMKSC